MKIILLATTISLFFSSCEMVKKNRNIEIVRFKYFNTVDTLQNESKGRLYKTESYLLKGLDNMDEEVINKLDSFVCNNMDNNNKIYSQYYIHFYKYSKICNNDDTSLIMKHKAYEYEGDIIFSYDWSYGRFNSKMWYKDFNRIDSQEMGRELNCK